VRLGRIPVHSGFSEAKPSAKIPPNPDYKSSWTIIHRLFGLLLNASNPALEIGSLFNPHSARSGSVQRILSAMLRHSLPPSPDGLSRRSTADRILNVMRVIESHPDADPDDARIINTWVRNQRSEHTRGVYRRDPGKLLSFSGKPLRAITLDDLQAFASELAGQGLAPISVGRTLAAVRSIMRFATRSGHLGKNVAADLKLPRYENRLAERILGEGDIRRIISLETGPRDRVLRLLLYMAGLRVSEACNLRWRNLRVRGDAGQLTVSEKAERRALFCCQRKCGRI
jgi:integrase